MRYLLRHVQDHVIVVMRVSVNNKEMGRREIPSAQGRVIPWKALFSGNQVNSDGTLHGLKIPIQTTFNLNFRNQQPHLI